jgi:hypothetical protein
MLGPDDLRGGDTRLEHLIGVRSLGGNPSGASKYRFVLNR